MTITQDQLSKLGAGNGDVYTGDHHKVGEVGQFYLDNQTGNASWVTVKTGLFGTSQSFVPLNDAQVDGEDVVVNFKKEQIKDAPRIDPGAALSPEEENQLYTYYNIDPALDSTPDRSPDDADNRETDGGGRQTGPGNAGGDTSGPTTDQAMTRSEEQVHVGTRTEESGRARLRKYVVTENVTQTVPVAHEEVRVEREPVTEADRGEAMDGPAISEEEHEVVLHEERLVVDKEAVPVERVRLDTETVSGEETVSDDVRRE